MYILLQTLFNLTSRPTSLSALPAPLVTKMADLKIAKKSEVPRSCIEYGERHCNGDGRSMYYLMVLVKRTRNT